MARPHNPLFTILLALTGAALGMLVWLFSGIGLVELGVTPSFDPIGVDPDRREPTGAARALEWAYPVFALIGAVLFPPFARWLARPSAASAEATR